jgi:hypothetical protein
MIYQQIRPRSILRIMFVIFGFRKVKAPELFLFALLLFLMAGRDLFFRVLTKADTRSMDN